MAVEYSWPETQDREEQQILDMLTVDFAEQEDYEEFLESYDDGYLKRTYGIGDQ